MVASERARAHQHACMRECSSACVYVSFYECVRACVRATKLHIFMVKASGPNLNDEVYFSRLLKIDTRLPKSRLSWRAGNKHRACFEGRPKTCLFPLNAFTA